MQLLSAYFNFTWRVLFQRFFKLLTSVNNLSRSAGYFILTTFNRVVLTVPLYVAQGCFQS
ncbi:hypothetical protein TR67_19050 [Pseudomonas deceptionensis]|nr:hypothetical protein TR67_19050 [Pseudomonas deceptionensis]